MKQCFINFFLFDSILKKNKKILVLTYSIIILQNDLLFHNLFYKNLDTLTLKTKKKTNISCSKFIKIDIIPNLPIILFFFLLYCFLNLLFLFHEEIINSFFCAHTRSEFFYFLYFKNSIF